MHTKFWNEEQCRILFKLSGANHHENEANFHILLQSWSSCCLYNLHLLGLQIKQRLTKKQQVNSYHHPHPTITNTVQQLTTLHWYLGDFMKDYNATAYFCWILVGNSFKEQDDSELWLQMFHVFIRSFNIFWKLEYGILYFWISDSVSYRLWDQSMVSRSPTKMDCQARPGQARLSAAEPNRWNLIKGWILIYIRKCKLSPFGRQFLRKPTSLETLMTFPGFVILFPFVCGWLG